MKKYHLIIICALLVFSCKKNKTDTEPYPEPQAQLPAYKTTLPLQTGNYWIYQKGYDDTLGVTHLNTNDFDSVYVQKDTLIAGATYHKIGHTNVNFQSPYYYNFISSDLYSYVKDSAGYLISLTGARILDRVNIHDTVYRYIVSPQEYYCIVPNTFTQKNFLIGRYSGNAMDLIYYRNIPAFHVVDTAYSTSFVKDLGIVKSHYSFSACLRNCRYSYNLIRYHLN